MENNLSFKETVRNSLMKLLFEMIGTAALTLLFGTSNSGNR